MAACIAARGFRVRGVDLNPQKVECMKRGVAPVKEPGLPELLQEAGDNLEATTNIAEAVHPSSATFVVVATPSDPGGGFSLQSVLPTCEAIGRTLRTKKEYHLVVLTSTVMPGATGGAVKDALERASGMNCGTDFGLCYSPEFIALGTVIRDFYNPDFLLIGESDARAGDALAEMYGEICKNAAPVARMNFINAEITKLAVNTYITTKISYANMLARLCERLPGADVNVVTDALGKDSRIGAKYLKGAVSYGGPCFPRDNRALAALAAKVGASSGLAEATDRFNRAQIASLAESIRAEQRGDEAIGILGLAYKPNTDVVEEAFGLLLTQHLTAAKLRVVMFDPMADRERVMNACPGAEFAGSAEECIAASGVVVVATPWAEFGEIHPTVWGRAGEPRVVVDCWGALGHLAETNGVSYVRLGVGEQQKELVACGVLAG